MNSIDKLRRDNAILYKAYHQAIYNLREIARELAEHLPTNYACSNCTRSEECRQYNISCEYMPAWMKEVEKEILMIQFYSETEVSALNSTSECYGCNNYEGDVKMKMCKEMSKLRELLVAKGVKWYDVSTISDEAYLSRLIKLGIDKQYADTTIYRTHFSFKGHKVSVINGYGTYGGYNPCTGKNDGYLEMMIDKNEPLGCLSAENVIKKLEDLE